jgi:serine/threonine protein phosphatase PrpC
MAAACGVICDPDVIEYQITPEDRILVMASDGVWEFLSNQDVIHIIQPHYERADINGACDALMKAALTQWT